MHTYVHTCVLHLFTSAVHVPAAHHCHKLSLLGNDMERYERLLLSETNKCYHCEGLGLKQEEMAASQTVTTTAPTPVLVKEAPEEPNIQHLRNFFGYDSAGTTAFPPPAFPTPSNWVTATLANGQPRDWAKPVFGPLVLV